MAGRSIEDMSIAFIGAGNLATNLAKALYRKGFRIVQVYSRTKESAQELAQTVEAAYTTELQAVTKEAQLYIVSLKDAAFVELLPQIVSGKENALWVHTAGSIPMNIWQGHVVRYGVLYPMQTFSKQREVDFGQIPCFVESNSEEDVQLPPYRKKCMKQVLSSAKVCIWRLCLRAILPITCMCWLLNC